MTALRASLRNLDVLLERRLYFEYAKLHAKRQLHAIYRSAPRDQNVIDSSESRVNGTSPTPVSPATSVKHAFELSDDHDHKRQRRPDSPAVTAPQTPMSCPSGLATSPDIWYDPGNSAVPLGIPRDSGVLPHRAAPERVCLTRDEFFALQSDHRSLE